MDAIGFGLHGYQLFSSALTKRAMPNTADRAISSSVFRVGVEDDYVGVIDDIMRLVLIQIVIQLMFYLNSPTDFPFFTPSFVAILLYIVLGVAFYWLIFRKIILFVPRSKRT